MDDRIEALMLMGSSQKSVSRFLESYTKDDSYFIDVFPDGRPNAVVAYRIEACIVEILDIAVDPEFRGQGIGARMIRRIIASHSPQKLIAETDDDAMGFYQKLGFNTAPFRSKWGIRRYKMDFDCTG